MKVIRKIAAGLGLAALLCGCSGTPVKTEIKDNELQGVEYMEDSVVNENTKEESLAEDDLINKPVGRIHSDSSVGFKSGDRRSDNLVVVENNGTRIGFERRDDNSEINYGLVIPVGKLSGLDKKLNIYALRSERPGGNSESEFIGEFQPFKDLELDFVGRVLDLEGRDGYSLAINYRQPGIFEEESNFGAGIELVDLEKRTVGGYAWGKIPELNNLFVGAGTFSGESHFVIGMPNNEGLTWRYFRIDADDGFELNELLFSTQGVNIGSIDFQAALRGNADDTTKAFTSSVFRYVVPPMSARGRGWTGGALHIKTPNGESTLDSELVGYFGDSMFAGVGYQANLDDYGKGRIIVPIGIRLGKEDDGVTRNFLRLTPGYDLGNDDVSLGVNLELKL